LKDVRSQSAALGQPSGVWLEDMRKVVFRMRNIKRYSNRKLYDTQDSRYVTLQQIAVLVRNGDEIRVVDKDTQRDLTSATLAQILFEEEKRGPRLPTSGLRQIIQGGRIP
jgi:polyhydroxyalkanoate synthesis repressor PhaR